MSTMLKEVYDALKEAGASEEKASAAAIAVSTYQLDRANLATKEDIARLAKATKEDIARLEKATKEDIALLKDEITRLDRKIEVGLANVSTEIERMGRVVIMWNVGTLIAVASLVFAIIRWGSAG